MHVPTIEELEEALGKWFLAVEEVGRAHKHYESLVRALSRANNSQAFASPEDWRAYATAQKADRDADRKVKIEQTAKTASGKTIPKESRERSCAHIQDWIDGRRKTTGGN